MTIRSFGRILVCGSGAWLWLAGSALAQENVGNAMNPAVLHTVVERDPDGLGITEHSRTPTGFLLLPPERLRTLKQTTGGWLYRVHLDVGGLGASGDVENAKFKEYKDWGSGFYLNTFGASLESSRGTYVEGHGGAVGRDDQFYFAQAGKYNAWRVNGFFNETPHVFTARYRSLWSGQGTDKLTLINLTPGGTVNANTTQVAIQTALSQTPLSDVALAREKGGARFDLTLPANWKLYTSYTREHRTGSRQFGLVFGGGGGGGNVEPTESVNNTANDVIAGVQYAHGRTSLNVQAWGSWFANEIDVLTIENPLFISVNSITGVPATSFTQARFDMHPDNRYYNVRADVSHRVPALANSRFTGVISRSRFRQDDPLQPWTTNTLVGGTINGVPTANVWNTTAALTKASTDGTIDTTLVDVGWSAQPADALDLRAKWRYYDTDNDTTFLACNPLTGQWGRLLSDGSGGSFVVPHQTAGNNPAGTLNTGYNGTGCDPERTKALGLVPSAANVAIHNIPFASGRTNGTFAADYRFNRHDSVEFAYEREAITREHRERDETSEHKVKGTYVNRGLPSGTLRVSYEHGWRRGSEYHPDPYEEFWSAEFGPAPTANTSNVSGWIHNIEQFRKFELADRNQGTLNARWNVALAPAVDLGISLTGRDASFPNSEFGRDDHQRLWSPNVDVNWQATEQASVNAFYSYQNGRLHQTGLQANACVLGNTYYFFSDGSIQTNTTGVPPAAPAGTSLTGTQQVLSSNWPTVCGTASATSPLYPTSRSWQIDHHDRNKVAGVGIRQVFRRTTASLNYTYLDGTTSITYEYNPTALGMNALQTQLAGTGHPDIAFRQHFLDLDALIPLKGRAGIHFIYRYEWGRIRDWAYDGVLENPVPANNAVYLDAGPEDYSVHVAGVLLRLDL